MYHKRSNLIQVNQNAAEMKEIPVSVSKKNDRTPPLNNEMQTLRATAGHLNRLATQK